MLPATAQIQSLCLSTYYAKGQAKGTNSRAHSPHQGSLLTVTAATIAL